MITANLLYTILLFVLYGIFDIAVPAVVLYPVVKDHDFGFRILFYQIAYLAYLSMMSFALAFIGIYRCFSAWLCFFAIPIGIRIYLDRKHLKELIIQKYRDYLLSRKLQENYKMTSRRRKEYFAEILDQVWNNYIKKYYIHFIVLLLFAFLVGKDLGYFHLNSYTYACSDEPTHIYWVSCLINKNPFPAGLYPHGMHFVVAQFCSMFGLNVARAWMSFGIVSTTIIVYSAYLLANKVFSNKSAGIIGVFMFLCSGIFPLDGWYQRMIMVMPMEFAMYAFFAMMYGLISWGKDQKLTSLIMIGLGLLGTTLIHFFVTIIAILAIVVYIVVYHGVMSKNKSIHKLMICGIAVVILAVLPYVVGLACGNKLEQSFGWGASTVSVSGSSYSGGSSEYTYQIDIGNNPISEPTYLSLKERAVAARTITELYAIADEVLSTYLTKTGSGGLIIVACATLLILYGAILLIFSKKKEKRKNRARSFLFIGLSWFFDFILLYVAYFFNWFSLMTPSRSAEFISILSILTFGSVFTLLRDFLTSGKKPFKHFDNLVTVIVAAIAIVLSLSSFGFDYHDLMYGFTMEDLDIKAEEYLVENAEPETWTYISTTNARMGIHTKGFHYEITDLLRCVRDTEELYIPTKDIYVMVEKNVPLMGNKLVDGSDAISSSVPVSAELADVLLSDVMLIYNNEVNSEVYLGNYSRQVIMSHLYYWMEKAKEVYPNEISVFMEDENCTIYHIRQDEYFLLDLVLDYSDLIQKDLPESQVG